MQKETSKKGITHWSPSEQLNYHFFLVCKADQLLSNKSKAQGFYVEMSEFIGSRDKVQCRSHHEKMINRFKRGSKGDKKRLQELNLKGFYEDHIALRLLDSAHLMKEIEHNLALKAQKKQMKHELYDFYKEKAEKNIQLFNSDPIDNSQVESKQNSYPVDNSHIEDKQTPGQTEVVPLIYPRIPSYRSAGSFLDFEERPFSNLFFFCDEEL